MSNQQSIISYNEKKKNFGVFIGGLKKNF